MRMQQADRLSQDDVRVGHARYAIPQIRTKEVPLLRYDRTWPISGFSPLSGASSRPTIGHRSAADARERYPTTMSALDPDPCPFCAMPIRPDLEANGSAFVVLDAYPVSPGHSLVISRRHVADIFDLTADRRSATSCRLIRSARERIDRTLQPAGYNIGVNVGRDAGQTVMHVHVHVIPRYPGDSDRPHGGVRGVIPGKARYSQNEGSGNKPRPER